MFKKNNYVTEQQLAFMLSKIDRRLDAVELRSYGGLRQDHRSIYGVMVSILKEAGILVEDKEEQKPSITWDNVKYKVRKVK